jgi:hypothetical protein
MNRVAQVSVMNVIYFTIAHNDSCSCDHQEAGGQVYKVMSNSETEWVKKQSSIDSMEENQLVVTWDTERY